MDKLQSFIDILQDSIPVIEEFTQSDVKDFMVDGHEKYFPMICSEYTTDSMETVDMDESNFLNAEYYDTKWVSIQGDCFMCFNQSIDNDTLIIDVLEVNKEIRREGLGRLILTTIEKCAKELYGHIKIQPFDTCSELFWMHMGYEENSRLGDGLYKFIG